MDAALASFPATRKEMVQYRYETIQFLRVNLDECQGADNYTFPPPADLSKLTVTITYTPSMAVRPQETWIVIRCAPHPDKKNKRIWLTLVPMPLPQLTLVPMPSPKRNVGDTGTGTGTILISTSDPSMCPPTVTTTSIPAEAVPDA